MLKKENWAAAPTKDTATQLQEFREMERTYEVIIAKHQHRRKLQNEKICSLWKGVAALSALLIVSTSTAAATLMQLKADAARLNQDPLPVPIATFAPQQDSTQPVLVEYKRYAITESERLAIVKAIVCETGGQDLKAAVLVAQCILNAAEHDGIRPIEVLKRYKYADYPVELTTTAFEAVTDVFDCGNTITSEPIMFFYAPDRVQSDWHETMDFVLDYGGHRYFKMPDSLED